MPTKKRIVGNRPFKPERGTDVFGALFINDFSDITCANDVTPTHICDVDLPGMCISPHVNVAKSVAGIPIPLIDILKSVGLKSSLANVNITKSVIAQAVPFIEVSKIVNALDLEGQEEPFPIDYIGVYGPLVVSPEPIDYVSFLV